jgi:hypothetical protein
MRFVIASLIFACSWGCGPGNRNGNGPGDAPVIDAPPPLPDACTGIGCRVVQCEKMGRPPTSISGTVNAPNGTLPLFGVTVYVPIDDPGPVPDGVECGQCKPKLPGDSVSRATTNELGRFTVTNVPSGTDVPVVVTIGKWRRRLVIPNVNECADNQVDPALTRLPKNKTEGDIPKIAMVTGNCDALECLIRKLGIEDSEFTNDTGTGRIHLYASNGASRLADNTAFAPANTLWDNPAKLQSYDISLFSCECSQLAAGKSQAAMNNIKAYADAGGRVFLSHYHNVWITGEKGNPNHAPPVWPAVASCGADGFPTGSGFIDTVNNPKGASFSLWMQYVMGSPQPGVIPIQDARQTCTAVSAARAERWVYLQSGTSQFPQNFQFSTPNEMPENARCGKVVFSDMHVASGSSSSTSTPFPGGCSTQPMTPQEKALAFMFFDIASCVGVIQ